MSEFVSSVSPKGQVTVPAEMRKRLGIKPKDRVSLRLEGEEIKIRAIGSRLDQSFQAVPALEREITLREMTDLAHEEHARAVAMEGL